MVNIYDLGPLYKTQKSPIYETDGHFKFVNLKVKILTFKI